LIISSNMPPEGYNLQKRSLTSNPRYSQIFHWKAKVGIGWHWKQNESMQRDGKCWQHVLLGRLDTELNHQFHVGLMGCSQLFCSGCT
jgi:hypothetical protein